jgi:flagellar motor switch protein FliM
LNEESESPEDDNADSPGADEQAAAEGATEGQEDGQQPDQEEGAASVDGEDEQPADSEAVAGSEERSDDESDESGVVVYDFNHPQHRLGDPLPQFKFCGKRIAHVVAGALSTELHVDASVELANASYCKKTEFISGIEKDACVFRSDISPFGLDLLVVCERGLILSLVDQFFGGASPKAEGGGERALSATETRFSARLRHRIIESLSQVCSDYFTISNSEETPLSTEELSAVSVENSVVAVQEYAVTGKESTQQFSIVYPWSAVEALAAFPPDDSGQAASEGTHFSVKLHEHIAACTVELQGQLAETEVTVSQLLRMQKGDFIPLGEVGSTTFTVDNTPVFDASIGASNGFVSASILHWSIEGDVRHE